MTHHYRLKVRNTHANLAKNGQTFDSRQPGINLPWEKSVTAVELIHKLFIIDLQSN